jgi:uncharacterized protein YjdB
MLASFSSPRRTGRLPNVFSAWRALVVLGAALSCQGDALDPDRSAVASVVVVPDRVSVGVGSTTQLTAQLRDHAGALLTNRKVVWASKDPTLATVSDAGVVTGVRAGAAQVAATAEGKSAIVDVTVNPKAVATIRLTPPGDPQLLVGQTRQMTAETLAGDGEVLTGRLVTWSSNTVVVASVSATGLITAVSPGGAVVTAASEGRTAVVAVTVSAVPVASVAVSPASDEVVVTQTLQLTATPKDAQGGALTGRPVSWSTSDAATATVSSTGLVTGVSPGSVTITASVEGRSGTSAITVKPKPVGAVILSPAQVSIETGQTRQLTAQVTDDQGNVLTGRPITFSTDKPNVATVSGTGLVTAVGLGTAKITATSEGKTGTADVTVTAVPVATVEVSPGQADVTIGQSVTLTATPRDARGLPLGGRLVNWTSGAPSVASVSASGVVTGLAAGTAVIFATSEGRTGSATVNVRQIPVTSVTVTPAVNAIAVSGNVQLVATVRSGATVLTDRVVGWSSSNDAVAVVSSTGRVTALKAGAATITATSEGVSGTAFVGVGITSIVVTPNPTSVFVGQTRQLAASARDATNTVVPGVPFTWSSASTTTATVDANGLVTGRAVGNVNVSAGFGAVSGASLVSVALAPVNTVDVTPPTATISVTQPTVQLTATLKDAGGNVLTGRTVAWSSSNNNRATVNSSGLVSRPTGATPGSVTITATSEGKSGTSTVTVQ